MRFHSTCFAPFLFVLFSVQGQLVPEGLLDFFPDACLASLESDLLPCAMQNLCLSLIPSEEEIDSIPSSEEIDSCADIEKALCPITTRCDACKEKADDAFKCVITNSEDVPQNVTDLVNGCSLGCTLEEDVMTSEPVVSAEPVSTVVPIASIPTAAPVTIATNEVPAQPAPVYDEAPVTASEPVESPTPVVSGTMSFLASNGEIITGLFMILISVEILHNLL